MTKKQKGKIGFKPGHSHVHPAEKKFVKSAESAGSGSSKSADGKSAKPSRRDQKVTRTSPVRTRSRSRSQTRPPPPSQRSRSPLFGFPSSPDTSATALVSPVRRNPKRCLSQSPTFGDFATDSAGQPLESQAAISSLSKRKRNESTTLPKFGHRKKLFPDGFDPFASDSDSLDDFPPLAMPKKPIKPKAASAAAAVASTPVAAAAQAQGSAKQDTLEQIDDLLHEAAPEAMETEESDQGSLPSSPPPSPTFKSILKSQSGSSRTIRPLRFSQTVSATYFPGSPSNLISVPNSQPLPPLTGQKRRADEAANSEEKRSRSGDEEHETEVETEASTVISHKKADPKKVRILCNEDPDGCMTEALFDRFHAEINELVLQDLLSGKLPPDQSCLGHFAFDARTSRGVVMILEEVHLDRVKQYTNLVQLEDEQSKTKVTFSAIGGAEVLQRFIYARVDRLPVKFVLTDPSPIAKYIQDRLPFLKADPVKLELEDFSFAPDALARKETKVLLKLVATDRLTQYLKANDWKIPFAGTLLPFEQPRKTGYEASLRQARRPKSPGPPGPRDRSRSTHARSGASPGSLGHEPHREAHREAQLSQEQIEERRRAMAAQHEQWVQQNAHLYANAHKVSGTPFQPPKEAPGRLAAILQRQRENPPPRDEPGHQNLGRPGGLPPRAKVRMDITYPPGSTEALIQENRRLKKAAKAKEAAARAEQAKLRLDNKFGPLEEPAPQE